MDKPSGTERPERRGAPRTQRRFEIDWTRYPSVVFESDDWGACEAARDRADAARLEAIWTRQHGVPRTVDSTLETPADLARLYGMLERCRGVDGQPAVFTAFVCVGNPDFAAIRASGFREYHDVGIDEAVPDGWQRGDVLAAWRDGLGRGVFAPEYHSNLHHTGPKLWLERLAGTGPEAEAARASFDLATYYQGEHLPEFARMNVREQYEWNARGIDRFRRAVGTLPAAAITSDAYPETETVWSLLGVRTVCLKNCRVNSGEIVVYPTKLWNNQDPACRIGDWDPVIDVVYMIRNVFFECSMGAAEHSAAAVVPVIRSRWQEGEPAMISTHRVNYVSLNAARVETGYRELAALLAALGPIAGVRFLTTAEVSDLYRNGWSQRRVGRGYVLRLWGEAIGPVRLEGVAERALSLPDGREVRGVRDGTACVFAPPPGDYWLEAAPARKP